MKYDMKRRVLVFSSGTEVTTLGDQIGIAEDLELVQGDDFTLFTPADPPLGEYEHERLTPKDCLELADEMLRRWSAFRALWAKES